MESSSLTDASPEIAPNSPLTFQDWIGRWKARLDSQMVVTWSPGKKIGPYGSGSEFAKDSLQQKARIVHISSLSTPSTSVVQESMEDMNLGHSSFLLSESRELTVSAIAELEGHWRNIRAFLSRTGLDDPNRASERLQDVKPAVVYVSKGGFTWCSTLVSSPKTGSDDPNWAFNRLRKINEAAAERIGELAKLQQNWDGCGGEPILQEAIDRTAGLLLTIHGLTKGKLHCPFIAPLPDGGLELEWEMDSGVELTLIVRGGGREIKYLLDVPNDSGGIEESEGLLPKDATLSELVTGLI